MNANKRAIPLKAYFLVVCFFGSVATNGATEKEVIQNIQKAQYIYVVRKRDAKAFVLLDKLKIGPPDKVEFNALLNLITDALCLEGDFGNGKFMIIHPIYRNELYFSDPNHPAKKPKRDIVEVFKKSNININFCKLRTYMRK